MSGNMISRFSAQSRLLLQLGCTAFMAHVHVGAATPEEIAAQLRQNGLANSSAVQIVSNLTTQCGSRLAGSDAEKRAAAWAKLQFEKMGFDRSWIEEFPMKESWERGIERVEVISPSPQRLIVTALGLSVATPAEGLTREMVLFRSFDDMLAMPAQSLSNKIVVVTERMIATQNGAGYGFTGRIRFSGPTEAARRGAAAYLLRSVGTESHRMPHTGVTDYEDDAPRIPAAALSGPDADQLERLADLGKPVQLKLTLTPRDPGPRTSQNVIAELRGRETPDQIVLLGAHLDSWDLGTGAIDDGAGVAIIMAAADLIRQLPERPKRTIRVVLYGAEEFGLYGGKAYAETHKSELTNHVIIAEADFGQGPVYALQTGVGDPEDLTIKLMRKALTPLGVLQDDNRSGGDSDIAPLFEAGVPAVTLKLDGMDYFNFHHSADDTFDKIEARRINQSATAYAVFGYLAAELGADYRAKAEPSGK